jgi:hypothetical protein
MLFGAIAHQILRQESPQTIERVKAVLQKHPWYVNQWQARLQDVPVADHGLVLFMQAARWADDIRSNDRAQNKPPWHYINFPFKPEGQPATVQTRESEAVNILAALAENERVVKNGGSDPERRAIPDQTWAAVSKADKRAKEVFMTAFLFVSLLAMFLFSPTVQAADVDLKAFKKVAPEIVYRVEGNGYFVYVNQLWRTLMIDQRESLTFLAANCYSKGTVRILDARTGKLLARWGINGYVNEEK